MNAVHAQQGYVLEVGCWEGRSTMEIANRFHPENVHCVDHWLGDLTDDKSRLVSIAQTRDVHADFRANMLAATQGNFVEHRMSWRDLDWSSFSPIRFLFIDAQHTYGEVFDNIRLALPFMALGGVIAGDDLSTPGVRRAVREALGDVILGSGQRSIWWKALS